MKMIYRQAHRLFALSAVVVIIFGLLPFSSANAITARSAHHLVPTGKGWAVDQDNSPFTVIQGNGINYHGGPVMPGNVNVYFIWYGNWSNGPRASDSATTVNLLDNFFGPNGIGGSGYELINSTYGDNVNNVSGNVALAKSTFDNYSQSRKLSDSKVLTVVSRALSGGKLPVDSNGIYFVLTSSDVTESSGFCNRYCGWHTHATISGTDIKYSFVGNPDRCPAGCEAETVSPNGDSGADGMASIMAHESEETISDPDLNAWYDASGFENADKCAWMFGPTKGTIGAGAYNETFGTHNWLIQMNWENASGGGCAQTFGGPFYNF